MLHKKIKPSCDTCEFFQWDEEMQEYVCEVDMDEDELYRMDAHRDDVCTFYKFYDEYKSVQKQN